MKINLKLNVWFNARSLAIWNINCVGENAFVLFIERTSEYSMMYIERT